MKSVFVQEWVDSELGHSGKNSRYSIHMKEDDRDRFARDHATDVNRAGRELKPIGRWGVVGIDEAVYEEVRKSVNGMWYRGKAYWDGQEIDIGAGSK